jgi:hypothetical protein
MAVGKALDRSILPVNAGKIVVTAANVGDRE